MPHEQRFACYILNAILGGGMSSRLFQNIREKQGLAYAIFSELSMYHDAGCMLVYAGTSHSFGRAVINSIVQRIERSRRDTRSLGRVAARQGSSERFHRAGHGKHQQPDGKSGAAGTVLQAILHTGRNAGAHRAVTAEEVQALARAVLRSQAYGSGDARTPGRLQDPPRGPDTLTSSSMQPLRRR